MELQTSKQKLYYKEVIRLHQEKGYGNRRISHILPISRSTVTKWITIFASENKDRPIAMKKKKSWRQAVKNLHTKDKRTYSVSILCKLFGITKQAYYKYDENRILEKIAQQTLHTTYLYILIL